jgi:aspartyl/glutamyl-tRNA(Asn/Gln) amidotransferase C subunit
MSVTPEEVARIADLARLRPEPETVAQWTREMNAILAHMDALVEADVSGVVEEDALLPPAERDPSAQPDPLRAGGIAEIAPNWAEGFFLVPRLPALENDA